jgi:hypothetical protein
LTRQRDIDCPRTIRPEPSQALPAGAPSPGRAAEELADGAPHVGRLAAYLGLDTDIVIEGLLLAAARDSALFGAASAAARRVRATSAPEALAQRYTAAG